MTAPGPKTGPEHSHDRLEALALSLAVALEKAHGMRERLPAICEYCAILSSPSVASLLSKAAKSQEGA